MYTTYFYTYTGSPEFYVKDESEKNKLLFQLLSVQVLVKLSFPNVQFQRILLFDQQMSEYPFLLKKLGFVGVFPGIRIEDSRILGVLFHWVKKLYL